MGEARSCAGPPILHVVYGASGSSRSSSPRSPAARRDRASDSVGRLTRREGSIGVSAEPAFSRRISGPSRVSIEPCTQTVPSGSGKTRYVNLEPPQSCSRRQNKPVHASHGGENKRAARGRQTPIRLPSHLRWGVGRRTAGLASGDGPWGWGDWLSNRTRREVRRHPGRAGRPAVAASVA